MSKVAIVTDSTAYLSPIIVNRYPITIAPLQVIWENQTYLDGVEITPAEFYSRLKQCKQMPSTSQATPGTLMQIYEKLLAEDCEILSIHISSKLSGTCDSAIQAKNNFPGAKIEVVDSESTAMAMGFQVLQVARAAEQGASLADCKFLAEKARRHTGVLFVVNTLEYLKRGGRIGGAAAFLGTALNLKPILELRDGRIEAIERVRTQSKAIDRMLELLKQRASAAPVRLATLYADTPEASAELLQRACEQFPSIDLGDTFSCEISPAIGVHAGPGCLGIAYMSGM